MAKIKVENKEITVLSIEERDYISLTDMANAKESESRAADIIKNWLRTRFAIEFLSVWEQINNPNFKVVESDHFKMQAGLPNFVLSASEWIEKTNAIGIVVRKGKYGGTFAHKDIAFEFGSAISVTFKLYLITEFQRLKEEEQKQLGWTARQWREANPVLKGNIRDYAGINQLICLTNMENLNAVFIQEKMPQNERLVKLNLIAIQQMLVLQEVENRKLLK